MIDSAKPLLDARDVAERGARSAQEKNRLWWETKPMTYAPWEDKDRLPTDAAGFKAMEEYLLGKSPYLRERFDWASLAGKKVLEIGSGAGALACRMARHGAELTAVDITTQGTTLTSRNAALQGLRVAVIQGDAETLPLPDNTFEFVWSWGVLDHTRSTEACLAEVCRVLKPGGRGLMMVYHRTSAVYYLKGLWWLIARGRIFHGDTFRTVTPFFVDGYDHRHFTRKELANSLRSVGLTPGKMIVTQQQEPLLPGLGGALDAWVKSRFGWYLVAEFSKP